MLGVPRFVLRTNKAHCGVARRIGCRQVPLWLRRDKTLQPVFRSIRIGRRDSGRAPIARAEIPDAAAGNLGIQCIDDLCHRHAGIITMQEIKIKLIHTQTFQAFLDVAGNHRWRKICSRPGIPGKRRRMPALRPNHHLGPVTTASQTFAQRALTGPEAVRQPKTITVRGVKEITTGFPERIIQAGHVRPAHGRSKRRRALTQARQF